MCFGSVNKMLWKVDISHWIIAPQQNPQWNSPRTNTHRNFTLRQSRRNNSPMDNYHPDKCLPWNSPPGIYTSFAVFVVEELSQNLAMLMQKLAVIILTY